MTIKYWTQSDTQTYMSLKPKFDAILVLLVGNILPLQMQL